MQQPPESQKDPPNQALIRYALFVVARRMHGNGYDEEQVAEHVKERYEMLKDMGGDELAYRLPGELGPEDYGRYLYGAH